MTIDSISEAFENNEHVLGIFIVLSKAFVTIDRKTLQYKLRHYGMRGSAQQWFTSYLCQKSSPSP